jgi:hypothetical protein
VFPRDRRGVQAGRAGGRDEPRGKSTDGGLTWWDAEIRAALRAGISRERYWTLTHREFHEEFEAWEWRERRDDARVISGAWWAEAFTRQRELPDLRTFLAEMFGDGPKATPQEQSEKDAAAARAWNRSFAAIWKAQEAAKAAGA